MYAAERRARPRSQGVAPVAPVAYVRLYEYVALATGGGGGASSCDQLGPEAGVQQPLRRRVGTWRAVGALDGAA